MTEYTNIYFDFEFIDDGREIVPISLGMCVTGSDFNLSQDDTPDELYLEYEFDPARANDWVRANVFPCMDKPSTQRGSGLLRHEAVMQINGWVEAVCFNTRPWFIGYYPSYDWVLLCQHFGTMMQTPKNWPMRPECLMQLAETLDVPKSEFPKQKNEHHALADAKWNRELHQFLKKKIE